MIPAAVRDRLRRAAARRLARRLARWPGDAPPTVSFCFDDFPASAVVHAAPQLEATGFRATWYAAAGLLGGDSASGVVADAGQVRALARAGHEIGNHGHGHRPASAMSGADYGRDAAAGRDALAGMVGAAPCSFSYPLGSVTPGAKRAAMAVATSARGIEPGVVRGGFDLAQLPAYAFYARERSLPRIEALLAEIGARGGWAILYTHDVLPDPSPWGCTPDAFAALVAAVRARGLRVEPVGAVVRRLA